MLLQILCAAETAGELDEPTSPNLNVRRYWVHPIHSEREKNNHFSEFYTNIRKFPEKFFEYYRMSLNSFDELLTTLRPYLTKQQTNMRNPISAE